MPVRNSGATRSNIWIDSWDISMMPTSWKKRSTFDLAVSRASLEPCKVQKLAYPQRNA